MADDETTPEPVSTEETPAEEAVVPAAEEPEAVLAEETPAEEAAPPAPEHGTPDAALIEAVGGGLTWIPYAAYLGAWVVLAGVSAYFLGGASAEEPARWLPAYVPLLWTGVGLTVLGPVLSLVVWVIARAGRTKEARRGLFASSMTRGALTAFFGVVIWIATLFVIDLLTVGSAL